MANGSTCWACVWYVGDLGSNSNTVWSTKHRARSYRWVPSEVLRIDWQRVTHKAVVLMHLIVRPQTLHACGMGDIPMVVPEEQDKQNLLWVRKWSITSQEPGKWCRAQGLHKVGCEHDLHCANLWAVQPTSHKGRIKGLNKPANCIWWKERNKEGAGQTLPQWEWHQRILNGSTK